MVMQEDPELTSSHQYTELTGIYGAISSEENLLAEQPLHTGLKRGKTHHSRLERLSHNLAKNPT